MITIIFYNFILFSSTFFVWLSERGKTWFDRSVLLSVAFLLVFLPSAIRYDIGTDYLNYLEIFLKGSYLNYQYKEPGFYFINWFLDNINAHFQWLFVIFSFIFTTNVFKAYPKKNAWLLHFLFFSMVWYFSFSGIRQTVALSFCLLAIFYYFNRRYILFFIFLLIGSTFHQSAFVIILIGIVSLIPLTQEIKTRIMPLVFMGFIILTFVSMNFVLLYMDQILNLIGLKQYSGYFSNSKHFATRDFGTGLGALVKLLFSIYIIFHTKQFIHVNRNYWLLIILIFAYAIALVLANEIIIFTRMVNMFIFAPIIAGYLLTQLPQNKQLHRTVLTCFVIFLVFSFTKDGMSIETSYSNPKRNPYQTVFEMD